MTIWNDLAEWFAALLGREYLWVFQVFLVVSCTLVGAFIVGRLLRKLMSKAEVTHNLWDDALFEALLQPARWCIWLVGLSFAGQLAAQHSGSTVLDLLPEFRSLGFLALTCWFLVRFIGLAERNLVDPYYTNKPLDRTTVTAIGKLLRISVVITTFLVVLQSLGYSVSGVLAFGGVGGLAVGFAAKDLLANFFGGLMVYLDRPFKVGDWIRSPDKSIEGTVEDIGWRLTRIRTFDKRPIYVPNSVFTQIVVENPSRMSNRRIYETIGVRYNDASKVEGVVVAVEEMLRSHPEIDLKQTLMVNLNSFAPSSLEFFIYTFTKTTDWVKFHQIKQDVLMQILTIIDDCGAECAFPTTTINMEQGALSQGPSINNENI